MRAIENKIISFILKAFIFFLIICQSLFAQNSVLINFGTDSCSRIDIPSFSLFKNPLSTNPILLANCNMQQQQSDIFSVFVAYNPKNNKVYIADIKSGVDTKIWVLDVGLPTNIACPLSIPLTPTYSYSYVSNNFEFDNNGDLWSFSNYDPNTGQCSLDKFDVTTGQVINTRILQFPAGNFPNTINSGDLCILPNGRLFATLGYGPSKLYEITNYSSITNATATYLSELPKDCYGIAYLNGLLEISGSDFSNTCYYYDYDISTGILGVEKPFQLNHSPIDNTSFTPAIGCTKKLVSATQVNPNTYDLSYEIFLQNMGNVVLNNIALNDDLTATFGSGNVSNVQTSFVPGSNTANLQLNPFFNGTTVTSVLFQDQNLSNQILSNQNYFTKVLISCRVSNIRNDSVYLNSAIASAQIGSGNNTTLVTVTDSSNNGGQFFVDPNQNGNPNEINENIPTPFMASALPVKFIAVKARLNSTTSALVNWIVATPFENAAYFTIEYKYGQKDWKTIDTVFIHDFNKSSYDYIHHSIDEGVLFYRIKEADIDGEALYSKIVSLNNTSSDNNSYTIFPNPAHHSFSVFSSAFNTAIKSIEILDLSGKIVYKNIFTKNNISINTEKLEAGSYFIKITDRYSCSIQKLLIHHY